MKKILATIGILISVCLLLWMLGSWIEVISKNLNPNPTYSAINFFTLIFR